MRLSRFLTVWAIVGFGIPVLFQIMFALMEFTGSYGLQVATLFVPLRLLLWPTSIGLMALDGRPNWGLDAFEVMGVLALLNAALYATVGLLFWGMGRLFGWAE